MLDSGSSLSLISKTIFRRVKNARTIPTEQLLFTASGNTMESLGEVELEIKISEFHSPQRFTITPSLITDCILGVDSLADIELTWISLNRVATGPNLGIIKSLNSQDSSEHVNHSFPIHDEQKYPNLMQS